MTSAGIWARFVDVVHLVERPDELIHGKRLRRGGRHRHGFAPQLRLQLQRPGDVALQLRGVVGDAEPDPHRRVIAHQAQNGRPRRFGQHEGIVRRAADRVRLRQRQVAARIEARERNGERNREQQREQAERGPRKGPEGGGVLLRGAGAKADPVGELARAHDEEERHGVDHRDADLGEPLEAHGELLVL
jgi:hypothetical protein